MIVRVDVLLLVLGGGEAALCTRKREDDGVGVGGLGMNKSRCKNSIPVKYTTGTEDENIPAERKIYPSCNILSSDLEHAL